MVSHKFKFENFGVFIPSYHSLMGDDRFSNKSIERLVYH